VTPRKLLTALCARIRRVSPASCFDRVRAGDALLVDVRERSEWERGFARSALLLPLSDLTRSRVDWSALRQTVRQREMILYCGAGVRSNLAARILCAEGFQASNGGALREWVDAGWPIAKPTSANAG
jgi:rhodanese-related sulfurtransferase